MGKSGGRLELAAAAALATALLAACEPGAPSVTVVQPAPAGAVVATGAAMTAANVAAIVVAANDATIERARVARAEAEDPRVRAFANRVFRESQEAALHIDQAVFMLGLAPQPEAIAYQLESDAAQTVTALRRAQGLEVDRIYLETEIANHRWMLGTIDAVAPTITVPAAVQELDDYRSLLAARLTAAELLAVEVLGDRYHDHHYHGR